METFYQAVNLHLGTVRLRLRVCFGWQSEVDLTVKTLSGFKIHKLGSTCCSPRCSALIGKVVICIAVVFVWVALYILYTRHYVHIKKRLVDQLSNLLNIAFGSAYFDSHLKVEWEKRGWCGFTLRQFTYLGCVNYFKLCYGCSILYVNYIFVYILVIIKYLSLLSLLYFSYVFFNTIHFICLLT